MAQGNGMVITGTPADVLEPASQTPAAGQVALVHGDVGEGFQRDGGGTGIGAPQRPLGVQPCGLADVDQFHRRGR